MPLKMPVFTRRAAQATPESSLEDTMRFTGWFLTLIAVITLSGCRPDMPETAFRTTIKVVDRNTGKPVPGALVLVGARISVEPEFEPPYDWAMAGNRAFTDGKGAARFKVVKGLHEGDKPNDPLWKALEARKPAVKRDILGVESGSILVLAPGYGLFHQPFGVTDNPKFNAHLLKRGETMDTFGGWFGRGYRAEDYNYPAVGVKAEELRRNREITVKVGKVTSTGEEHRFVSFMPAIIGYADVTMSKDSGTTRDEKLDIYAFLMSQLEYAVKVSTNPAWREGLNELKTDEMLKEFIAWKPDDAANHESYIHDLLTLKALERLTDEHSEVKEYAQAVLAGVKAEDDGFRYVRHFYNPAAPDKGLLRYDNALKWGAIGYPENPDNDWDWEDAKAYYRAGDKRKAYKALGHVVHLLQDLGVPMHTRMIPHITAPENRFETYFNDMAKDLGGLPPQYWQTDEPVTAKGVKEKFEAVADLTFSAFTLDGRTVNFDDHYTQGGILKTPSDDTLDLMGRHLFPKTIAHTAGLMRAFHAQVNPAAYAQAPVPGAKTDMPDATAAPKDADSKIRLDDGKAVLFTDKKGAVVKRLTLPAKKEKIKIKLNNGKEAEGEKEISAIAVFSKNGKFAAINTKTQRTLAGEDGRPYYRVEANEIAVYDVAGKLLYKRDYPENTYISDPKKNIIVADAGTTVVFTENSVDDSDNYWPKLHAYNKKGEEILVYPDDDSGSVHLYSDLIKISSNGRYLAVRGWLYGEKTTTIFFDLETKKSWRAPHSYLIFEMTDDGSVRCDYYDTEKGKRGPVSRINLKAHLGE
ncbi:MAG: hypothetical protein AB1734_01770 [Elusimicrobiota bacterium]